MYELINKLARKAKYSKQIPLFNKVITQMYYEPGVSRIRDKDVDYVVVGGNKFYSHEQLWCVTQPDWNQWLSGVRETDICLDIGADIGGITIPLAKRCKEVTAVEPVWFKELERNISLNKLSNVRVLPIALTRSRTKSIEVKFGSKIRTVAGWSLLDILANTGPVDFLKMDIEGAEWSIPLYPEILTIRELRIEFHRRRGHKEDITNLEEWKDWLECNGYEVILDRDLHNEISILFSGIDYMRASKRH